MAATRTLGFVFPTGLSFPSSFDRRRSVRVLSSDSLSGFQAPLTVIWGPLVDEVHQRTIPWISQISKVYKGKEHVEVEFIVGSIPIDDGIGKEVVTQISSSLKRNKNFYTDSSGLDYIKRICDYRSDWKLEVNHPIAGNYYPVIRVLPYSAVQLLA